MKALKYLIILTLIAFVQGCDYLITDYKLDTNPDLLKTVSLLQYIEQGQDTTLTLYSEGIKYAKLDLAISEGNQTRIVPTNKAIRSVLATAGVTQIKDLSPNVIKGLFSYLTIPGNFRSINMEAEQTIGDLTMSGDSIFLTRNVVGSDRYHLYVNKRTKLATNPIEVIRQDYVFKDGVAHVVDFFPVYQESMKITDPVPDGVDYSGARKDTLWITEDSNVYFGSKTSNYNGKINYLCGRTTVLRYTFLKFGLAPITYTGDLASAKLCMYVSKIDGSNYVPSCGVYETAIDWNEKALTWNNKPSFGQEVSVFDLGLGWNSTNVTRFILNLYKNNVSTLSLGLMALNGSDITSSSVQIYNSEASSGRYKPFISLMSAIPSELHLNGTSPITVKSNGISRLSKENVSMSGTSTLYNYTDNNIIYVLKIVPTQGTLTHYGLPMTENSQFTQEEMTSGAIKYVHNGNGTTDTFILKAQDYLGGVYPELIPITINIQ